MSQTCRPVLSRASGFLKEVMERSGQDLQACYQCRRCAAGCPVGRESGITPDKIIRLVVMGLEDEALENTLVWRCLSCYTCGTRCPNDIQTSSINETLQHMSKERKLKPILPKVAFFHSSFVDNAGKSGRINEISFMQSFETKSAIDDLKGGRIGDVIKEALGQAKLGLSLMSKKRMHFGSEKIKRSDEIKAIYAKSKKYKGRR
jgi:heterodisulfide reductase subunit C